jgi:hypothetical protein
MALESDTDPRILMSTQSPKTDSDLLRVLDRIGKERRIASLRSRVRLLREQLSSPSILITPPGANGSEDNPANVAHTFLINELDQIERTKTLPRARYYVERLKKSLLEVNTRKVNDINLNRWKEYGSILTDSLWLLEKRDGSGGHSAWYWGNFVPQIPQQLMLRYTKKGDWVLDPFAGSGTTLLECQRMGRNCLGVELQASVAKRVRKTLMSTAPPNASNTIALEVGDSKSTNVRQMLRTHGTTSVQLVILHPPYHNIIQFSRNRRDLSNARTAEEFAAQFGKVVDNVTPVLDSGRILAVIIGDKYEKGEWKPLGFLTMTEVLKRNYKLKSIVIKNFDSTAGKRSQKELWRFRALAGGFYVFKHEYIFIFQKG